MLSVRYRTVGDYGRDNDRRNRCARGWEDGDGGYAELQGDRQ